MLEQDGIVTLESFEKLLPSEDRRKAGPYVIMECFQKIPCNPCRSACHAHAVSMEEITDTPSVKYDSCTGCAVCVGRCPGQACFVIDETFSEDRFLLTLPYEFLPVPEKGQEAALLGRDGAVLSEGTIQKVFSYQKTYVVTVDVPKQYLYDVRNIKLK